MNDLGEILTVALNAVPNMPMNWNIAIFNFSRSLHVYVESDVVIGL